MPKYKKYFIVLLFLFQTVLYGSNVEASLIKRQVKESFDFLKDLILGNDSNSNYSSDKFIKLFIKSLERLNISDKILYENDIHKFYENSQDILDRFYAQLQDIGFELIIGLDKSKSYRYLGDNPALALDKLLQLDVLIIECRGVINLAGLLALKEFLGDDNFNQFVAHSINGELSTDKRIPIFDSHSFYRSYMGAENTDNVLNMVEVGDFIYIAGVKNGFGIKPSSEYNGYNLICTSIIDGIPRFKGFSSFHNHEYTYQEIKDLFLTEFHKLFTFKDLLNIYKLAQNNPDKVGFFGDMTNLEIWEKIIKDNIQMVEIIDAITQAYSMNENELLSFSGIAIPKVFATDKIIGISSIYKANHQVIMELPTFKSWLLEKKYYFNNDDQNSNITDDYLELNFQITKSFQANMYGAIDQFYKECLQAQEEKKFSGLILFGDAGTGKTHLSDEIILKLKAKGINVWANSFNKQSLSSDLYTNILSQSISKNHQWMIDKVVRQFADHWADVDVFYFDDIKKRICAHTLVTEAAILFARQNKKCILINSNQIPFYLLSSFLINPLIDRLNILEVRGEDFRQNQIWWRDIAPYDAQDTNDLPNSLVSGEILTLKQQEIQYWLEQLKNLSSKDQFLGIAIFGSPGIGKSTMIKFALQDKNYLWINMTSIHNRENISEFIARSDLEYVVVDDVNDAFLESSYSNLMFDILNQDVFVNSTGNAVKFILVSNKEGPDNILNDLKKNQQIYELATGMSSRFFARFKMLILGKDDDLRLSLKNSQIAGKIIKESHSSNFIEQLENNNENANFIFCMSDFNETLRNYSKIDDFKSQNYYRQSIKDQFIGAKVIIVDWNENPDFNFINKEFAVILDLLDEGKKIIFISYESPEQFLSTLHSYANKMNDSTGKYISRLNLLEL